jgi:hypothetical protein
MMPENVAAVAWLFGTEPTDRALTGWRPRVWVDLGNGQYHKEWWELARRAPCRYSMAWHESVTSTEGEPT